MQNPFSLKNKTIFVTGASSGIGKATAIECSKMGARLIISGRNEDRLKETYSSLKGDHHEYLILDISIKENLKTLHTHLPLIDGLVNCAGLTIPKPFKFVSETDLESIMGVNFEATFLLTQSIVKNKKMNKGSSIVFVSSISGTKVSYVGNSVYSASKGAINGFAKGLAVELAPNIRVNTVIPGMINTKILAGGEITEAQLKEDIK